MPAKGTRLSEETKRKIGLANKNRVHKPQEGFRPGNTIWRGRKHKEESKKKISAGLLGKKLTEAHKLKLKLNHVGFSGKKVSEEHKLKLSNGQKGEKGSNWQGGKTKKSLLERKSLLYNVWRKQVFERDDWTCQVCGVRGGKLEADHIKSFASFPDLRLKLENGQTLCKPCHKKTDNYGHKEIQKRNSVS